MKLLLILSFINFVSICYSNTVKLCEDSDFHGSCLDVEFKTCTKLPKSLDKTVSSLKINGCVKLYTGEDCSGFSKEVEKDNSHLGDFNDVTSSISDCQTVGGAFAAQPPEHWQEHWFDHRQVLTRVFYDDEVAIYFDNDVDKSIKWPFKYLHDVWVYTKKVYGPFGEDKRLFGVFHAGKYGGGHPSTYFDASHDYRNVIDCGSPDKRAWTSGRGNDLDLATHEIGHIVEGASHGTLRSPAFPIWGDSKWAEIYIYDVYNGLNRAEDAKRWHDLQLQSHDNFPRANTYWFRDWFYPIYSKHGGSQVLNGFFELLSKYFPKNHSASQSRPQFTRDMNHGEFFHFWSGAAHTNLKSQAEHAFGWNDKYEKEFQQAQKDFPQIKY